MKKTLMTIAIVLGLSMTTFAGPNGGGLFQRGDNNEEVNYMNRSGETPMLPAHGSNQSQDATAPVGSGIAILVGLGAAYLVGKRRKE